MHTVVKLLSVILCSVLAETCTKQCLDSRKHGNNWLQQCSPAIQHSLFKTSTPLSQQPSWLMSPKRSQYWYQHEPQYLQNPWLPKPGHDHHICFKPWSLDYRDYRPQRHDDRYGLWSRWHRIHSKKISPYPYYDLNSLIPTMNDNFPLNGAFKDDFDLPAGQIIFPWYYEVILQGLTDQLKICKQKYNLIWRKKDYDRALSLHYIGKLYRFSPFDFWNNYQPLNFLESLDRKNYFTRVPAALLQHTYSLNDNFANSWLHSRWVPLNSTPSKHFSLLHKLSTTSPSHLLSAPQAIPINPLKLFAEQPPMLNMHLPFKSINIQNVPLKCIKRPVGHPKSIFLLNTPCPRNPSEWRSWHEIPFKHIPIPISFPPVSGCGALQTTNYTYFSTVKPSLFSNDGFLENVPLNINPFQYTHFKGLTNEMLPVKMVHASTPKKSIQLKNNIVFGPTSLQWTPLHQMPMENIPFLSLVSHKVAIPRSSVLPEKYFQHHLQMQPLFKPSSALTSPYIPNSFVSQNSLLSKIPLDRIQAYKTPIPFKSTPQRSFQSNSTPLHIFEAQSNPLKVILSTKGQLQRFPLHRLPIPHNLPIVSTPNKLVPIVIPHIKPLIPFNHETVRSSCPPKSPLLQSFVPYSESEMKTLPYRPLDIISEQRAHFHSVSTQRPRSQSISFQSTPLHTLPSLSTTTENTLLGNVPRRKIKLQCIPLLRKPIQYAPIYGSVPVIRSPRWCWSPLVPPISNHHPLIKPKSFLSLPEPKHQPLNPFSLNHTPISRYQFEINNSHTIPFRKTAFNNSSKSIPLSEPIHNLLAENDLCNNALQWTLLHRAPLSPSRLNYKAQILPNKTQPTIFSNYQQSMTPFYPKLQATQSSFEYKSTPNMLTDFIPLQEIDTPNINLRDARFHNIQFQRYPLESMILQNNPLHKIMLQDSHFSNIPSHRIILDREPLLGTPNLVCNRHSITPISKVLDDNYPTQTNTFPQSIIQRSLFPNNKSIHTYSLCRRPIKMYRVKNTQYFDSPLHSTNFTLNSPPHSFLLSGPPSQISPLQNTKVNWCQLKYVPLLFPQSKFFHKNLPGTRLHQFHPNKPRPFIQNYEKLLPKVHPNRPFIPQWAPALYSASPPHTSIMLCHAPLNEKSQGIKIPLTISKQAFYPNCIPLAPKIDYETPIKSLKYFKYLAKNLLTEVIPKNKYPQKILGPKLSPQCQRPLKRLTLTNIYSPKNLETLQIPHSLQSKLGQDYNWSPLAIPLPGNRKPRLRPVPIFKNHFFPRLFPLIPQTSPVYQFQPVLNSIKPQLQNVAWNIPVKNTISKISHPLLRVSPLECINPQTLPLISPWNRIPNISPYVSLCKNVITPNSYKAISLRSVPLRISYVATPKPISILETSEEACKRLPLVKTAHKAIVNVQVCTNLTPAPMLAQNKTGRLIPIYSVPYKPMLVLPYLPNKQPFLRNLPSYHKLQANIPKWFFHPRPLWNKLVQKVELPTFQIWHQNQRSTSKDCTRICMPNHIRLPSHSTYNIPMMITSYQNLQKKIPNLSTSSQLTSLNMPLSFWKNPQALRPVNKHPKSLMIKTKQYEPISWLTIQKRIVAATPFTLSCDKIKKILQPIQMTHQPEVSIHQKRLLPYQPVNKPPTLWKNENGKNKLSPMKLLAWDTPETTVPSRTKPALAPYVLKYTQITPYHNLPLTYKFVETKRPCQSLAFKPIQQTDLNLSKFALPLDMWNKPKTCMPFKISEYLPGENYNALQPALNDIIKLESFSQISERPKFKQVLPFFQPKNSLYPYFLQHNLPPKLANRVRIKPNKLRLYVPKYSMKSSPISYYSPVSPIITAGSSMHLKGSVPTPNPFNILHGTILHTKPLKTLSIPTTYRQSLDLPTSPCRPLDVVTETIYLPYSTLSPNASSISPVTCSNSIFTNYIPLRPFVTFPITSMKKDGKNHGKYTKYASYLVTKSLNPTSNLLNIKPCASTIPKKPTVPMTYWTIPITQTPHVSPLFATIIPQTKYSYKKKDLSTVPQNLFTPSQNMFLTKSPVWAKILQSSSLPTFVRTTVPSVKPFIKPRTLTYFVPSNLKLLPASNPSKKPFFKGNCIMPVITCPIRPSLPSPYLPEAGPSKVDLSLNDDLDKILSENSNIKLYSSLPPSTTWLSYLKKAGPIYKAVKYESPAIAVTPVVNSNLPVFSYKTNTLSPIVSNVCNPSLMSNALPNAYYFPFFSKNMHAKSKSFPSQPMATFAISQKDSTVPKNIKNNYFQKNYPMPIVSKNLLNQIKAKMPVKPSMTCVKLASPHIYPVGPVPSSYPICLQSSNLLTSPPPLTISTNFLSPYINTKNYQIEPKSAVSRHASTLTPCTTEAISKALESMLTPTLLSRIYNTQQISSSLPEVSIPISTQAVAKFIKHDSSKDTFKIPTENPCVYLKAWYNPIKVYTVQVCLKITQESSPVLNVMPVCSRCPACIQYASNPQMVSDVCRRYLTSNSRVPIVVNGLHSSSKPYANIQLPDYWKKTNIVILWPPFTGR